MNVTDHLHASTAAQPPQSAIRQLHDRVHLVDAFTIALPAGTASDPEVLARFLFAQQPGWVGALMHLRDAIVACFGLKTGSQLAKLGMHAQAWRVGIFRIYGRSGDEIVLGEDDRHLDFRVSVLYSSAPEPRLTVSTVVHCHNLP